MVGTETWGERKMKSNGASIVSGALWKNCLVMVALGLFVSIASAQAYQPMGLVPGQYTSVGGETIGSSPNPLIGQLPRYEIIGGVATFRAPEPAHAGYESTDLSRYQIVIPAVCLDRAAAIPASTNRFAASRGDMVFRATSLGKTVREMTVQEALDSGELQIVGNDTTASVKAVVRNPKPGESYEIDIREFSVVGRDAAHVGETRDIFTGIKAELTEILSGHLRAMVPLKDKAELGEALYSALQGAIWEVQSGGIGTISKMKATLNESAKNTVYRHELDRRIQLLIRMTRTPIFELRMAITPEEQHEQLIEKAFESSRKDNPDLLSGNILELLMQMITTPTPEEQRKQLRKKMLELFKKDNPNLLSGNILEGVGKGFTNSDLRVIEGIFGTNWVSGVLPIIDNKILYISRGEDGSLSEVKLGDELLRQSTAGYSGAKVFIGSDRVIKIVDAEGDLNPEEIRRNAEMRNKVEEKISNIRDFELSLPSGRSVAVRIEPTKTESSIISYNVEVIADQKARGESLDSLIKRRGASADDVKDLIYLHMVAIRKINGVIDSKSSYWSQLKKKDIPINYIQPLLEKGEKVNIEKYANIEIRMAEKTSKKKFDEKTRASLSRSLTSFYQKLNDFLVLTVSAPEDYSSG
jgi:hypothetical protein